MKKLLFVLLSIFLVQTAAKADNDKIIQLAELPAQAQTFVKTHFQNNKVALVKLDDDFFDKSYEVIFTDGNKIEFLGDGAWEEVNCKYSAIPKAIVPTQITSYVNQNYPETTILKIEKKKRGHYEIELSNHLELTFNSTFQLTDIDN